MPFIPHGTFLYRKRRAFLRLLFRRGSHALEERARLSVKWWQQVESHFGTKGFFIGICSIFWRESWKYGERAFRYCNHDVGHALAALSLSANVFGWKATYLNALSDEAIENILGLDKKQFMGTGAWFFLIVNTSKLPIFIYHEMIGIDTLQFFAYMLPFVVIGTFLGRKLLMVLSQKIFSHLVLLFAALSSLWLIFL